MNTVNFLLEENGCENLFLIILHTKSSLLPIYRRDITHRNNAPSMCYFSLSSPACTCVMPPHLFHCVALNSWMTGVRCSPLVTHSVEYVDALTIVYIIFYIISFGVKLKVRFHTKYT